MPISRVVRTIGDARDKRYSMLRGVFRGESQAVSMREELRTVPLIRGAHAVGKSVRALALDTHGVTVRAVRRDGIVGRNPDPDLDLREDDVLVLYGTPEAVALAETQVLMG